MRIDNSGNRRRKKEKQRREQSIMEKEIFRFVEQSLQKTMDIAFDEIFKGWNKK